MSLELSNVAYHEAGHALAVYRFNFFNGTGKITIKPDGVALGHIEHEDVSAHYNPDQSKFDEWAIVSYAGYVAEKRHDPNAEKWRSAADEEKGDRCAGNNKEHLLTETEKMVSENWHQIECLAAALLENETLSDDEWSLVIDAADEGDDWHQSLERLRALYIFTKGSPSNKMKRYRWTVTVEGFGKTEEEARKSAQQTFELEELGDPSNVEEVCERCLGEGRVTDNGVDWKECPVCKVG